MRLMPCRTAALFPCRENRLDVAPVAALMGACFGDGRANPLPRIGPFRLPDLLGDQRRQRTDMSLVQREGVRTSGSTGPICQWVGRRSVRELGRRGAAPPG